MGLGLAIRGGFFKKNITERLWYNSQITKFYLLVKFIYKLKILDGLITQYLIQFLNFHYDFGRFFYKNNFKDLTTIANSAIFGFF